MLIKCIFEKISWEKSDLIGNQTNQIDSDSWRRGSLIFDLVLMTDASGHLYSTKSDLQFAPKSR